MHHCLHIPELVEHICWQLQYCHDLRSLAALARTASFFQRPALDVLWHSQSSLKNLLKYTMPSDLFKEEIHVGRLTLKLRRPILSSDWEPTRPYATRVKKFCSVYSQDGLSYSTIFLILALSFPGDFIFPNLTHLEWVQLNDDFPFIRLLLGPQVTTIQTQCASSRSLSLLSLLPRKCSSLRHVAILLHHIDPSSTSANNVLSEFITQLRCVEYLDIDIPDMAALRHVALLPSLQSLDIRILPEALATSSLADNQPLFVPLRHLRITNDSELSLTTHFVDMCSEASLESFILEISTTTPPPTISRILRLLSALAASHRASLRALRIELDHEARLTIESLRPVLRLVNLTHVDLKSKYTSFDFDDAAVEELARAWPRLQSLDISLVHHRPVRTVRTTLRAVQLLAQHCPELTSLGMAFLSERIPALDEAPAAHRCLRLLDVKHSPLDGSVDALLIARFISSLFPELGQRDLLTAWDPERLKEPERGRLPGDFVSHDRWEEVRRLLGVLALGERASEMP